MDAIMRWRAIYTEPDYSKYFEYTTNSSATLITKYIGTDTNVSVPNKIKRMPVIIQNSTNASSGVFTNNRNIKSVIFKNSVTFTNNSMAYTFYSCTNLTQAPNIPNSVTNMYRTFYNCTNLTQAPNIPNSVTNMAFTFNHCTNLTQAPNIPNSVTNMSGTFLSCSNLTQAPEIPNSVTNMAYTFRGCSNLPGSIIIRSENITNFRNCFYQTNASKIKKVYIPYKYANGINTKTYNAAFNSSYGINGKNGVTVYDINTYTG